MAVIGAQLMRTTLDTWGERVADLLPDPLPLELPSNPVQPDLLTRKLTWKEVLLWGALGLLFMAVTLGVYAWNDQRLTAAASPPRIPLAPSPTEYTVATARQVGLDGDSVEVSGEIVAAESPSFGEMPVVWIADEQFGSDSSTGLPFAIPITFLDDANVTLEGRRVAIKSYVHEVNLKHNAPRVVRVQATVQVVGRSAFVSECKLESEIIPDP